MYYKNCAHEEQSCQLKIQCSILAMSSEYNIRGGKLFAFYLTPNAPGSILAILWTSYNWKGTRHKIHSTTYLSCNVDSAPAQYWYQGEDTWNNFYRCVFSVESCFQVYGKCAVLLLYFWSNNMLGDPPD